MKRLKKFNNPRMISARCERADVEKFENILGQQPFLTLQDFISFAVRLFNEGKIRADGKEFVLSE